MSKKLHQKWNRLQTSLRCSERLLIAFSGGCDSAFMVAAARQAIGKEPLLAVTAVSASLPAREREAAREFARRQDVAHHFLETDELANPQYSSNPTNRCFFCKDELFMKLAPLAAAHRMTVADGLNTSDLAEYRPGVQAAKNWKVIHPLVEADLNKKEIRILSRWMKLSTWNKPASPCLSSRIPHGTRVTPETLAQIEQAEAVMHRENFPIARVRHFAELARIEVPIEELPKLREPERWSRICQALQKLGYARVEADPNGFQSGRLSAAALK